MKVVGKSLPVPAGWDFHQYRYVHLWSWVLWRWFHAKLILQHFDLIHIMTQVNAGVIPRLRKLSKALRLVVNIDATGQQLINNFGYSPIAHKLMVRAERRILGAADLIVCRSAWAGQSLVTDLSLPENRIHVAPNSMHVPEVSAWDPRFQSHRREMARLVFVGSAWKRKGGDLVLNVHQHHFADRAELHIVGSRRQRYSNVRNVIWHGYIPREQLLNEVLPTMDVFLFASREDMLPWAALEAASLGLPVIASDLAAIKYIVLHGKTGLLFKPGDVASLTTCISKLVEDRELRETMGKAGRAHVQSHYNPDVTYPNVLDRLVALVDRHQR